MSPSDWAVVPSRRGRFWVSTTRKTKGFGRSTPPSTVGPVPSSPDRRTPRVAGTHCVVTGVQERNGVGGRRRRGANGDGKRKETRVREEEEWG